MRIVQINSFFSAGGTARIVNGIYDAVVAGGDVCRIAAGRGDMVHRRDSYRICGAASLYRNAAMARMLDNEGFNGGRATRRLIADIKDFAPDVIHLHNLHGYYLNIKLLFDFLKSYGRPVVWTLHDCWAFTGHCAWFSAAGCGKWRSDVGCDDCCCQLREYPMSVVADRASVNYRLKREIFTGIRNLTIVTPSHWLADCVGQSFLNSYGIEVIQNGVDTSTFHPVANSVRSRYGIGDKILLLGVATPWIRRKGFFDFIKLARRLNRNYVVMLVGISKRQRRLLPDNVIAVSPTASADELAEYYSAADLLLNLSAEETFGLVTVEALACGTPALVLNSTACPEPVDGTCGMVINPSAGIEGIEEAIYSEKWRKFTAESCRNRALEFAASSQFPKYRQLYDAVSKHI